MAGIGDTLRKGISDATGMSAVTNALGGNAPAPKAPGDFVRSTVGTSGIDTALSAHADEKHPVPKRKPVMGADWD